MGVRGVGGLAGRAVHHPVRARGMRSRFATVDFSALDERRVLAPLFPTWVDGVFTLGDPNSTTPYNLADTFKLASLPSATKTIYLDFDGHHSVNNAWNHDIVFPAYDRDGDPSQFSDDELIEIQRIFQNVAEDFLPFNVNVTTTFPGLDALTKSGPNDQTWGIRSVHTQATNGFGNGIGGVAFLNSFDSDRDDPCFSFNKGENNGAMTQSHEIGHTLGLRHDGLNSQSYHPGTGSGPTSWGPIMGAPFGKNVVQWSKGEYAGATNTEDDLAIITSAANGFGFRPDEFGDSIAAASALPLTSPTSAFVWGVIGRPTDVDFFSVTVGQGDFTMNIRPFQGRPNLDIEARLYDSSGNLVATSNPTDNLTAEFVIPGLAAGTYYVSVDGVGLDGVYTDYGSMGLYTVEATFAEAVDPSIRIGESGLVSINHIWKTVRLDHEYVNPVVIAGPATRNGGDPLTIRVRNVTSREFQIRLDEWDYLDGRHSFEDVGWIVVEAGRYELPNGMVVVAGRTSVNQQWKRINFGSVVAPIPVLFTQAMTENDPAAVTTRVRNLTNSTFEVRLQEEEAANPVHAFETVGWLAITEGTGRYNGLDMEIFNTPVRVNHQNYTINFQTAFASTPVFLADMQTYIGGDPATIRVRTINQSQATIFVEEERSKDFETGHSPEQVGYLAMQAGTISYSPAAPLAMRSFADWFRPVTDDPARLAAAWAVIEGRSDEWLSPGSGNDDDFGHGGGCCCGACLGAAATSSESDAMLAAVLFQRTTAPQSVATEDRIDNSSTAFRPGSAQSATVSGLGNAELRPTLQTSRFTHQAGDRRFAWPRERAESAADPLADEREDLSV